VVSPSCDFGVCLQRDNHPALDFEKWVGLQMSVRHGYNNLMMAPRLNPARCNQSDAYSIKCWSYTEATFPEIPDNVVKWFVCNCEIQDDRLVPIPFGIFGNKEKLETANAILNYPKKERDKLLYINFQFYTTDRHRLFVHFKTQYSEKQVTCKQQCSFDEFLEDLATHKYVLCPTGNGLDCYRTLESVYMGAVPIVETRLGSLGPYIGLNVPLLTYPNLFMVDPYELEDIYPAITNRDYDFTKALWPYWETRISQCRSEL
jgi:hypothetical protein